jgi:hypothetical protein
MLKRATIRPSNKGKESVPKTIPSWSHLYEFVKPIQFINYKPRPFVAHWDYEFIARKNNDPEYLAKSIQWFNDNPRPKYIEQEKPQEYSHEFAFKIKKKYHPHVPPVEAMVEALRLDGYPEDKIKKYIASRERDQARAEKDQEMIDRVFGKFPSINKNDKKPKKIIKAVKKKI